MQLRAAIDVLNRNGIKSTGEVILAPRLAPATFSRLTDDELRTLLVLVRKASI